MRAGPSNKFKRSFKKLPIEIQRKAIQRIKVFEENPFDSRLGTHKLHGKKSPEWAFSVDYFCRIIFVFVNGGSVVLSDIGTHDELY